MGKVSGMFSKGYGVFMKMFLSHDLTLEVEWSSSSSHDLGGFLTLDSKILPSYSSGQDDKQQPATRPGGR